MLSIRGEVYTFVDADDTLDGHGGTAGDVEGHLVCTAAARLARGPAVDVQQTPALSDLWPLRQLLVNGRLHATLARINDGVISTFPVVTTRPTGRFQHSHIRRLHYALTRSHPTMVGDMLRVTLNFDLSEIPFVHF